MSSNIRIQRICQYCCNDFEAKTTVTKYCSLRCAQRAYKQRSKTQKIETSNKATKEIKAKPITELRAKEFLSIAETCKLLGISKVTFHRVVNRGQMNVRKVGRRTIIKRVEIDRFLDFPYFEKNK